MLLKRNILPYYTVLFSLLCASIPFSEHIIALPNIIMGLLILLFPFVHQNVNWKLLKNFTILSFVGLIIWTLLGIVLQQNWKDFSFFSKIGTVLLLFILSLPIKNFKQPLVAFIISSSSLLIISGIKLLYHFVEFGNLKLDVGKNVNELLMGERPFLGFIYLVSFCLSFYLFKKTQDKKTKYLLIGAMAFFILFILIISARLSTLSLIIILGLLIFYSANKWKSLVFIGIGIIGIGLFLSTNSTFKSRLTAGFEQESISLQKVMNLEPRYHIWSCSLEVLESEHLPILGYGFRNTIDHLTNCYETRAELNNKEHRQYFVNSRFNTHNQYLNFLMSTGIIGLILFAVFMLSLLKFSYKNYFTVSLAIALILFCLFENVLSRQQGAMLFSLSLVFIFFIARINQTEKDGIEP